MDASEQAKKALLAGAGPARAELLTRLTGARQAGRRDVELDLLIRLAAVEVAAGQTDKALAYLDSAAALVDDNVGTALAAGRMHYIRGQALAHTERAPGQVLGHGPAHPPGQDPGPSFAAAVDSFREAGSRADELRARLRVIELLQARGRVDQAVAELTAMIADLHEWKADRGLADCYRYRAGLHALMGRLDDGLADYDQAVAAAERLGDRSLCLRMRLERRTLAPYADRDAAHWDQWQALIAEAADLGDSKAAGDIRLQQAAAALQADDFAGGLEHAQAAQQAALDAGQPILYTMACMLMAEAREGLGDHAGVIEVLLTCKASLEHAYGRELAVPILTVLDSLEPRWGKAVFDQALAQYRAWARARSAAEQAKSPSGHN